MHVSFLSARPRQYGEKQWGWMAGRGRLLAVTQPGLGSMTLPPTPTEEGRRLRDCPGNFFNAQMRKLRLKEGKALAQGHATP